MSKQLELALSILSALSIAEGNKERELSPEERIFLIEEAITLIKKANNEESEDH